MHVTPDATGARFVLVVSPPTVRHAHTHHASEMATALLLRSEGDIAAECDLTATESRLVLVAASLVHLVPPESAAAAAASAAAARDPPLPERASSADRVVPLSQVQSLAVMPSPCVAAADSTMHLLLADSVAAMTPAATADDVAPGDARSFALAIVALASSSSASSSSSSSSLAHRGALPPEQHRLRSNLALRALLARRDCRAALRSAAAAPAPAGSPRVPTLASALAFATHGGAAGGGQGEDGSLATEEPRDAEPSASRRAGADGAVALPPHERVPPRPTPVVSVSDMLRPQLGQLRAVLHGGVPLGTVFEVVAGRRGRGGDAPAESDAAAAVLLALLMVPPGDADAGRQSSSAAAAAADATPDAWVWTMSANSPMLLARCAAVVSALVDPAEDCERLDDGGADSASSVIYLPCRRLREGESGGCARRAARRLRCATLAIEPDTSAAGGGGGGTSGGVLGALPALEARIVCSNSAGESGAGGEQARRVRALIVLDLDSAIRDEVHAAQAAAALAGGSGSSTHGGSGGGMGATAKGANAGGGAATMSVDAHSDRVLTALKALAQRQRAVVIVVRTSDAEDARYADDDDEEEGGGHGDAPGASACVSPQRHDERGAMGQRQRPGAPTTPPPPPQKRSQQLAMRRDRTAAQVASYHAVNCRVRVATVAVAGRLALRVQVCKSAWCGASVADVELAGQ